MDKKESKLGTYTTNQALGILINGPVIWELQLILQYPDVHIRVIVGPERCLANGKSDISGI